MDVARKISGSWTLIRVGQALFEVLPGPRRGCRGLPGRSGRRGVEREQALRVVLRIDDWRAGGV
jgi:hypothetical protein